MRPSLRSQQLCGWPGKPISRPTSPTSDRRGQMTSPACFHKWLPLLTSWAQWCMRCRRTGVAGGISEPPTGLAKISSMDIHFSRIVAPNQLPKIMRLDGTHSLKALQWQNSLNFCPWCRKEGQNEGIVVNHLHTMHYHLGLICAHCLNYFTISTDTMQQHAQLCKSTAASNDDNREESPPDYEKMTMAMVTSNLHSKKTRPPHHLHIPSSHGQLDPLHWCPLQGRPFFPKPSSNSKCSFILAVPVLTHYSLHSTMLNT